MKQRLWFYASVVFTVMLLITYAYSVLTGWTAESRPVTLIWVVCTGSVHAMLVHYSYILFQRNKERQAHIQPDSN